LAHHDVCGVGNALVDLQVRVGPELLSELGVKPGFMTLVDASRQEAILAGLKGREIKPSSGGSAANTVAGVAELGGRGAYACKVASDEWGRFYAEDLRRLGITVAAAQAPAGVTGTVVVMITPDAQRTMFTHLGVSADLMPEDLDAEMIAASKWLYVEGYLLPGETTREAALEAIGIAREKGVKVALTVSDPFCVGACRDLFWELLGGSVDLLFCNEAEAKALTGLDDLVACANAIHRHAGSVALTYGARGSLLVHEKQVHPIEGVSVQAVDTTGAGDMYAAGILHGITHGLSWPAAGRLASHAAARVVAHLGARLPRSFTATEMLELGIPPA
jgi:sugar/nucleoside kinase (ribokinase family)